MVGGGSAGMSGADNILENGGGPVLLDTSFYCGDDSTRVPAKKCREQELSERKAWRILRIFAWRSFLNVLVVRVTLPATRDFPRRSTKHSRNTCFVIAS